MARASNRSRKTINCRDESGGSATHAAAGTSGDRSGADATDVGMTGSTRPKRINGKRKAGVELSEEEEEEEEEEVVGEQSQQNAQNAQSQHEQDASQRPRKRRAKANAKPTARSKDESETMPLASRTTVSLLKKAMYVGAHVSAAGGVQNAIPNATHIGANALALFLKSQRKWDNPPLSPSAQQEFATNCLSHGYAPGAHALPHGSYLINLAQADEAKAAQAYASFLDDLRRCESLGIKLYNFHPGSTGGADRQEALARIAAQLNRAHAETASVVTVLENMAGAGNVLGGPWEDLRDIIALVTDKTRVGVCIDTCHAFAAGHDLRTPEAFRATMRAFDNTVGMRYLKALHLNDSKAPLGSNRDLHANIGTGFLGLGAFHSVMNHDPFRGMPLVLETPIDVKGPDGKSFEDKQIWADEIKLLESLIGMDPDSGPFVETAARLQERGEAERRRVQEQVDRKLARESKKGEGRRGRRRAKAS